MFSNMKYAYSFNLFKQRNKLDSIYDLIGIYASLNTYCYFCIKNELCFIYPNINVKLE